MIRARDETGMVLVIALMVIVVSGLLAGSVVLGSIQTDSSTNRDGNLKASVAAADAGLQVATYRLNMLAPSSASSCVTNAVVSSANGQCPQDGPESLGNGATFTFWTSPVLSSSSTCAGLQITNSQSTVSQRCVTSIGAVNGVSARVQARVAAFTTTPAFTFPMLGLNSVSLSPNDTVQGPSPVVGTNGQLTVGNNATVAGCELGAGAPAPSTGNGVTLGTCTTAPSKFFLPPVNTSQSLASNDDQRIINGLNKTCASGSYCDPSSGGVTFDMTSGVATTRVLNMPGGSSLTLGGGTYNFCNFTAGNNAKITIAATAKVQIYIDSPSDTASGCAAGTGNFAMSQNDTWVNTSQDPTNQQIWVYGCSSPCTSTVSFYNNSNSYMSLYAPQSAVSISGSANTVFDGAIDALSISIGNVSTFTYDGRDTGITLQTSGQYYRTAWAQCPATPTTPSDPTSGC